MNKAAAYDVVIIGAGISGLVCGCYLAKGGLRVLMLEKHHTPGGYCTTFTRKGFRFDAAADCFGAYRQGGITRKILQSISIGRKLKIVRADPSNMVITPEVRVSFMSSRRNTIAEFTSAFPREKRALNAFFNWVRNGGASSFSRIRNVSFRRVLDDFFSDEKLKSVLSIPLLATGGLPPSMMSAIYGTTLYSEFLMDGGYQPEGGMQALSDALAGQFRKYGGTLLLSTPVKRIQMENGAAAGITADGPGYIPSRTVVSACDARTTFLRLIGTGHLPGTFRKQLTGMTPSLSNFVLYFGLDGRLDSGFPRGTALYYLPHHDVERAYRDVLRGSPDRYGGCSIRISHDGKTLNAVIPAAFRSRGFWEEHKSAFAASAQKRIEEKLVPGLGRQVILSEAASPWTLYRYTGNCRGASYGWAGTPSQFAIHDFRQPSFLRGVYLSGHWSTLSAGISGAAYTGFDTARIILRRQAGKK